MILCRWCGSLATRTTRAGPDAACRAITVHDCDDCWQQTWPLVRKYPYRKAFQLEPPLPGTKPVEDVNLLDFLPMEGDTK